MRVLVTDGNERSTLAVARALGRQRIQVLVGAETARNLASASKYCWQSFTYPSPYVDAAGFVSRILDYIKRHNIAVVFPMSDIAMTLIGQHQRELEKYAVVPMPTIDVFNRLSDKYRLMELAAALKVPIPETIFVPNGHVQGVIARIRHFPVVVKPARSVISINGHWKKTGVHYAANAKELSRLYREVDYLRQPSLIQRRIQGQGQGIFVLLSHGNPVVLFAHRRLREKPPSGGVSVFRESIGLPEPATEHALRLLQHVKWHGVAMVEFKVDAETTIPLLMEVNGRFWGSLQLAVDAGVNFPHLLYQLAAGQRMSPNLNGYRVGIKSRWLLGDVDHLLLRLRKPKADRYLPLDAPSKLNALLDFCRICQPRMRYEVMQLMDLKPFVYELKEYLKFHQQ